MPICPSLLITFNGMDVKVGDDPGCLSLIMLHSSVIFVPTLTFDRGGTERMRSAANSFLHVERSRLRWFRPQSWFPSGRPLGLSSGEETLGQTLNWLQPGNTSRPPSGIWKALTGRRMFGALCSTCCYESMTQTWINER